MSLDVDGGEMEPVTPDDGSELFQDLSRGDSVSVIWVGAKDQQKVCLIGFTRVIGTQFVDLDELTIECFNRVVFEMMRECLGEDGSDDWHGKRRIMNCAIISFGGYTSIDGVMGMLEAKFEKEKGTVSVGSQVETM
jgi:hypothetical protein